MIQDKICKYLKYIFNFINKSVNSLKNQDSKIEGNYSWPDALNVYLHLYRGIANILHAYGNLNAPEWLADIQRSTTLRSAEVGPTISLLSFKQGATAQKTPYCVLSNPRFIDWYVGPVSYRTRAPAPRSTRSFILHFQKGMRGNSMYLCGHFCFLNFKIVMKLQTNGYIRKGNLLSAFKISSLLNGSTFTVLAPERLPPIKNYILFYSIWGGVNKEKKRRVKKSDPITEGCRGLGLNRNDGPHTHTLIHLSLFKTDLWSTLCINPFNHTLSLSFYVQEIQY